MTSLVHDVLAAIDTNKNLKHRTEEIVAITRQTPIVINTALRVLSELGFVENNGGEWLLTNKGEKLLETL